jgi:hypothetical protein
MGVSSPQVHQPLSGSWLAGSRATRTRTGANPGQVTAVDRSGELGRVVREVQSPGTVARPRYRAGLGGETSCDNGALICERHHTAVHEGGFRVARDPGTATWRTYRPDGTEIVIRGPAP